MRNLSSVPHQFSISEVLEFSVLSDSAETEILEKFSVKNYELIEIQE